MTPGTGYHARFALTEQDHGVAFTDDLQIHVFELPKFDKGASDLSTALDAWLYFLRHGEELDMPGLPVSMDKPGIRQAMEALTMLAHTDTEREIYEAREKTLRDERARLYHATTAGLDKGELIGSVRTLQRVLGQAPTPRSDLRLMSMEELERMAEELEQQYGK